MNEKLSEEKINKIIGILYYLESSRILMDAAINSRIIGYLEDYRDNPVKENLPGFQIALGFVKYSTSFNHIVEE